MVEVKCDRCGEILGDYHFELFQYVADEDGEDVELSWDLCSTHCLVDQSVAIDVAADVNR